MSSKSNSLEQACAILGISKKDLKKLSKQQVKDLFEMKIDIAKNQNDHQKMNDLAAAYQVLQINYFSSKKRHLKGVLTLGIVAALGVGGYRLVHKTVENIQSITFMTSDESLDGSLENVLEPQEYEPIHNTYEDEEIEEGDYTVYRQIAFDSSKNILDIANECGVDVVDIEMNNTPETLQEGIVIVPYTVNYDDLSLIPVTKEDDETINQFITRTETAYSTLLELNQEAFDENGNCCTNSLLIPDYNALSGKEEKTK